MPVSDRPLSPASPSRRTLLRGVLTLPLTALIAACSPTTSLTPARQTRPAGTPSSAVSQSGTAGPEQPTPRALSLTTPTLRPSDDRATPTLRPESARIAPATPSVGATATRSADLAIGEAGRAYRLYTDVRGTVQFSNCWDGDRTALVEGWIADLAATHPGIKVENDVGDAVSLRERQVTALASGTPPNVMMVNSDSIPFFAEQDALLPLDELMARDGIAADWFASREMASRRWDGRTYGLPQTTIGAQHLLFVNIGLLEGMGLDPADPIETWQDLEALVEPARRAGLLVMDPVRVSVGMTAHQVWTYANGGQYWDDDLGRIAWADPGGLQAAERLLGLVKAQGGGYDRVASEGDPRTPFRADEWAAEKYLCCVNEVGWLFELQRVQRLRYAVYDFPRNAENPASSGATPSTGGWTLAIPRSARDHEAAWEWVKLTTVSPSACAFSERQRRPSPLVGCDDRASLPTTQPFWPAISSNLHRTVPVVTAPIHPQLEQIYQDMQAELLLDRRAPRDPLEAAALAAQQLLDDWTARHKRP